MESIKLSDVNSVDERFHYYQQMLEKLTMMSDMFMRNVLNVLKCSECVLRIITENKNLKLTDVIVQKDYKNLQGRSVILDCIAANERKEIYDIEIQHKKEGARPKRTRYYSSMIDSHSLYVGEDFEKLPESKVIFIVDDESEKNVEPILHIKRTVKETGKNYDDKSEIIYINALIQEDTELGKLMHDFHCSRADDMYSEVLANRVRELKETQEGVKFMCKEMDKIYQAGEIRGKYETAIKLIELGVNEEMIAEAVGHNIEEIHRWKNNMKR